MKKWELASGPGVDRVTEALRAALVLVLRNAGWELEDDVSAKRVGAVDQSHTVSFIAKTRKIYLTSRWHEEVIEIDAELPEPVRFLPIGEHLRSDSVDGGEETIWTKACLEYEYSNLVSEMLANWNY